MPQIKRLLQLLAKHKAIKKIFIEPHLKTRWGLKIIIKFAIMGAMQYGMMIIFIYSCEVTLLNAYCLLSTAFRTLPCSNNKALAVS